ncbi:MAG: hypothetical protein BroJett029_04420 [Alphaproteobacteria bacterium]|nr:MAG: hypothetical protein BroJett029_04420 [Alphaproteobacteria bacterium]
MAYDPPVAVYDACVLYPFHLRNLLVQCAVDRLIAARWTEEVHDEWIRNLSKDNANLSAERLKRTRDLMNGVLPDADVKDYKKHIETVHLPDPDDRHLVAAGISARASLIVTWNTAHFPDGELVKHGLKRRTPDELLIELYNARQDMVVAATANARRNLTKSGISPRDFLEALDRQRAHRFVDAMKPHIADI